MRISTRTVKAISALVGTAATIVMGLSAVAQDQPGPAAVTAAGMTQGQTTTETTAAVGVAPSAVATPIARPVLKAKRPRGF